MIKNIIFLCSLFYISCLTINAESDHDNHKPMTSNYPILCSKLKPIEDIEISELAGSWLTLQSLLLRDGFPDPTISKRNKACVRMTFYDATGSGLTATSDIKIGDKKRRTANQRLIITDQSKPGVWEMKTRRPSSYSSKLLVLAAKPNEYLVLAYCEPMAKTSKPELQPALWIKILARGNGLPKRELISLHNHLIHMLHVKQLETVDFDIKC